MIITLLHTDAIIFMKKPWYVDASIIVSSMMRAIIQPGVLRLQSGVLHPSVLQVLQFVNKTHAHTHTQPRQARYILERCNPVCVRASHLYVSNMSPGVNHSHWYLHWCVYKEFLIRDCRQTRVFFNDSGGEGTVVFITMSWSLDADTIGVMCECRYRCFCNGFLICV